MQPEQFPMHRTLRWGARTRSGSPCRSPAVRGKRRCRMHGGAAGTGAPIGNKKCAPLASANAFAPRTNPTASAIAPAGMPNSDRMSVISFEIGIVSFG